MFITSSLIGFAGFGSVWMLLWGIGASIPIIIHLWSKRRYQEMTWAAMEYLLSAMRKNAHRIRIEQLILLAIRVSVLLLLALALADPILALFPRLGTGWLDRQRRHVVLVIDGSYSMQYQPTDKSCFEQAQEYAVGLVEQSRQGDGFTLVMMSEPARVVIGSPAFEHQDVISEIEGLRPPHAGADLTDALAQVEQLLDSARRDQPRLTSALVYFLTDRGAATWRDVTAAPCRRHLSQIDEQSSIVLVDVGSEDTENLAITDLRLLNQFVIAGQDATWQTTIKNFGAQDHAQQFVEFLVDGRRAERQHISVPAGGTVAASFRYRFDAPGEHRVEARLGPDPLAVDNHRYFAVPVRESLQVLCVSGKQGAARNVAVALQPYDAVRSPVRVQTVSESALVEADLHRYDCIFLCNVGRFGRDEAGVLHEYVGSGRGLIFFLGDQVQADSYNLELGGELGGQRVLPARVGATTDLGDYRLDPRDYRHGIVSPFRGHERTGLLTTPVWKYFQLEPFADSQAKIALWFDDGSPAIVEEKIGRGRSILVATAASEESVDRGTTPPSPWTALSAWPSFPPLIQEMLACAVQDRYRARNVEVGEEIQASVRSSAANLSLTVSYENERRERVRAVLDGQDSQWSYADTDLSGIYQARYEVDGLPRQYFGVNVNTRESDLQRIEPEDLPSQFDREQATEQVERTALAGFDSSWPIFRVLLATVLVLLLVETFLARQFGAGNS